MNGPEHYAAAERALADANDSPLGSDAERFDLGRAQIHATLALAAATLEQQAKSTDWAQVIA